MGLGARALHRSFDLGPRKDWEGVLLAAEGRSGRCTARSDGKSGRVAFSIKGTPSHLGLKPWKQLSCLPLPQPTHLNSHLSCKSSPHNYSWTRTFLHILSANNLVQVPSSPFLASVKASWLLLCLWPFTSVISFLFCCQIICPKAQFWLWNSHTQWGSLGLGTRASSNLLWNLGKDLQLSRCRVLISRWGIGPNALNSLPLHCL